MLKSLRWRLALTYVFITLLTLSTIIVYVYSINAEYLYNQRRIDLMTKANIISTYSQQINANDYQYIEKLLGTLGLGKNRVIITDRDALVRFDNSTSINNLYGKTFADDTIISALNGESSSKTIDGRTGSKLVSVSAPVMEQREIFGAAYIEDMSLDIEEHLTHLMNTMLALAIVVSILVCAVSLVMANILTAPIGNLTAKIKEMAEGNVHHPVYEGGSSEIVDLVGSFNRLVTKINDLEEKRRTFVSNASHELKTPLSTIKLICDSIIQNPDTDKQMVNEFLGDMNGEVDRLTRIIERLLDLTKMDEENNPGFKSTNLKHVVLGIVKALRPLAKKKGVKLVVHSDTDIFMSCDTDRLWEAVYNIVDNSIKYTDRHGQVTIELYRDTGSISIIITDTGLGISDEHLDRIFERFYRVDDARARETGGTGLGLSIAQSAVKLHGGEILVESHVGEGSRFKICLPVGAELAEL